MRTIQIETENCYSRYTKYQPTPAVKPEARKEMREKKKTAARTGMQQQKCLDIAARLW